VPRKIPIKILRNEQIGNASGLYNLLRNIGGIGISVVNTIVTRHSQAHRVDFSRYFTPARVLQRPFGVGPSLYHVGPQLSRLRNVATIANGLDIQATV
jgi:hypothetical protein